MSLMPVQCPVRLASLAQIEPLFAALKTKIVGAHGWRATRPPAIDRLIDAVELGREATVSFEGGVLSAPVWAALAPLVRARAGFFDLETPSAALRLWPDRAWVLTMSSAGWTQHDLASPEQALTMFEGVSGAGVRLGSVTGINAETKRRLPAFLHELHAVVTATLDLSVRDAVALAEQFPGDAIELQADHVIVSLPELTVTKYLVVHPDTDRVKVRDKWLEKLAKAMKRAGIQT